MIYKGCERKMIMIKNTGSDFFDEAYFILKEKLNCNNDNCEEDIIKEANRIVNENTITLKKEKNKRIKPDIISFIAGVFGGVLISAALFLILK